MSSLLFLIFLVIFLITLPGNVYLTFITIASFFGRQKRPRAILDSFRQPIDMAVIIPAHNESENLSETLNSLKACRSPSGTSDIYVVADNCSDNTADVALQANVNVIIRNQSDKRGKGYALDYAFNNLDSKNYDAYIVLDADMRCEDNFLTEIEAEFQSGQQVLQAPNLVSISKPGAYPSISDIGFRAINILRPMGRSALGLSEGIFGTGFALRKSVLQNVPYTATSIVEDTEYHIQLVSAGYKSKLVRNTGVFSEMPTSVENASSQRERWEGGRMNLAVSKARYLISEIFDGKIRLLEPLMELSLLPLTTHTILIFSLLLSPFAEFRLYSLISICMIALHVFAAISLSGGGLAQVRGLMSLPKFIFMKLLFLKKTISSSRKKTQWKKTERE